jgi:fumarate reductase subunit C
MSSTFAALTNPQKTALAIIDIGDAVSMTKTYSSGAPLTVTQALAVEGVDHNINVASGHRVTIYTSNTIVLTTLILDDITFGIMNSTNSLG